MHRLSLASSPLSLSRTRAGLSTNAAAAVAAASLPRHDWTRAEIQVVYDTPLLELVFRAANVHRSYWHPSEVQKSTLLSIKTGGCSENCGYCSQSQHHDTFVKATPTLKSDEIMAAARRAKEAGSTRFCMGSAWREVGNKHAFKRVLEVVKEIDSMGMEVCTTLGMLTAEQAKQLKEAGLTAYNHNLDTSPEYYPKVVTTRTYEERLQTLANVRAAGISVCCGGIIGMGEEDHDRVGLLHVLATMSEHPESVPINALVPVKGTPLGDALIAAGEKATWDDMVRMIATARVVLPRTAVRLSAGRKEFPVSAQALMFLAGANSIFTGDQLLTTANPAFDEDNAMFKLLGLEGKPPHAPARKTPYKLDELLTAHEPPALITRHEAAPEAATAVPSAQDEASLKKLQRLLRVKSGPGMDEFVSAASNAKSGCA
jgi:biotin synthase